RHVPQFLSSGEGWLVNIVGGLSEADVMSNHNPSSASETPPTHWTDPPRRRLSGRLKRLILKELREILRDRRTIITLVVMPMLIYPLLAVVFQRFLVTSITTHSNVRFDIGVDSPFARQVLEQQLRRGQEELLKRQQSAEDDNGRDL